MQLQDLGTFVTVAAERSFSVAAKKLHRKGVLRTKPEVLFRSGAGTTSRADFALKFEAAGGKKGNR